jgi:inner membrane protein
MPTSIGHAAFSLGVFCAFPRKSLPLYVLPIGCFCSIAPDLDVIAFRFGIPYSHPFGHRGLFHGILISLMFALVIGTLTIMIKKDTARRSAILLYLGLVTLSHGLLDCFTNGGLGIALFSPFSTHRYFSPYRPIAVSPFGIQGLINHHGLLVLQSELVFIGILVLVMISLSVIIRFISRSVRA